MKFLKLNFNQVPSYKNLFICICIFQLNTENIDNRNLYVCPLFIDLNSSLKKDEEQGQPRNEKSNDVVNNEHTVATKDDQQQKRHRGKIRKLDKRIV